MGILAVHKRGYSAVVICMISCESTRTHEAEKQENEFGNLPWFFYYISLYTCMWDPHYIKKRLKENYGVVFFLKNFGLSGNAENKIYAFFILPEDKLWDMFQVMVRKM